MTENDTVTTIDPQTYRLLKELMGAADFKEVIEFFYDDTATALRNLARAIATQQTESVATICHKLKSSSQLLGAFAMTRLCVELEKYPSHNDHLLASALLTQLAEEFQRVKQWIIACEQEAVAIG